MSEKKLFTFKQLGFDGKPLDISLPPTTETMQNEAPKSVRCYCWYFMDKRKEEKND